MDTRVREAHDQPMNATDETTPPPPPPPGPEPARRLTRSTDDKVLTGLCGGLGAIGYALDAYRGLEILAFSGALLGVAAWWSADRVAAGMVGARELVLGEAPAVHSMVDRLALTAEVVKPRLYVLPDSYPRALSAGRGAGGGSGLAVSIGLLGVASPAELEGIVAHEIAHLRHRAGGDGWAQGETHAAMQERIVGAVRDIAAEHPDESVLLVIHGGTMRALLAAAEGMEFSEYRRTHGGIDNGSLVSIAVENGELTRID